ncbi:MAG: hypothetical protein GF308_10975 [Candidatus Heimdallarchaeota archaeon]|nr:hypothetical protein [Candidatus Heimdallarchaeota archaeon]
MKNYCVYQRILIISLLIVLSFIIIDQTRYSTNFHFQKLTENNSRDVMTFTENDEMSEINSLSFNKKNTMANTNDSDVDGLPDSWEEEYGCVIGIDDSQEDYDQDGLVNIDEYLLGCDPYNPDSDGDHYNDGFEANRGTDPTNSADHPHNMAAFGIAFTTSLIIILAALGIGIVSINRSKNSG